MDEKLFLELLKKGEGPTLDYKSEQYRWDDHGKASLVKDLMSMANTPREGNSYILIGARKVTDQLYEPVDVPEHRDGAELQTLVRSWVHPPPQFTYNTFTVDGKRCGAFTIEALRQGPCQSREDLLAAKVRRWVIYWRSGDRNTEATPGEQREIWAWFNPERIAGPVYVQPDTDDTWSRFVAGMDAFESGRTYVLVTGPIQDCTPAVMQNVGVIDWDFILDFDPDTEVSGLGKAVSPIISERRTRHLRQLGDRTAMNIGRATYWLAAKGLSDVPTTLCRPNWRDWSAKCSSDMREQLKRLSAASSQPCTVLIAWDQLLYIRSVCEAVNEAFGERAKYVFAATSTISIKEVADQFEAEIFPIGFSRLCHELSPLTATRSSRVATETAQLPGRDASSPYLVTTNAAAWLSEELDVLYLSAGTNPPPDRIIGRDYYRGHEICWYELGLRYDIERSVTSGLRRQLERDLSERVTARVNLFHNPGAGGSTVARRIVWDLHYTYPCVVISRSRAEETFSRLQHIFSKTGQSILALVEGGQIKDNDVEDIYNTCRASHVPAVFLNVARRFIPVTSDERRFYLGSVLDKVETDRFIHQYGREAPSRTSKLSSLASATNQRFRTPFYFGLEAFGVDFDGLTPYIRARVVDLTPYQKDIVCFLSLAHHYGQRPLNAQLFADLLSLPRDKVVHLERALPEHTLELMLTDEDNDWRPVHDLIAQALIERILCPDTDDTRQWKQGLSTWGIRFAEFCRYSDPAVSDDVMETVRRCFLLRDNKELLGTEISYTQKFSQWLEDIPSTDVESGKLALMTKLTELFPYEAHFWAHLGRFYSVELKDWQKALDCVDKAIELSPEDSVLRHMKGMIFRQMAYELMSDMRPEDPKTRREEVLEVAKNSAAEFQLARELAPDDPHGYISHIQLITRVIDYNFILAGGEQKEQFITSSTNDPWIREGLDEAEDLLEQVRRLREGEKSSEFEEKCRIEVDRLYGRFHMALQGWNNMLTNSKIYKPPIRRQLVRTYLAQRGRSWDNLEQKDLERIISLLQDNMLEEPRNDRNLSLWIQAVRRVPKATTLDSVIDKLSGWRAQSDSLDSHYYVYILHALKAMEGSPLSVAAAAQAIEECKRKSYSRRNRTMSFEWVGTRPGLGGLVNHARLGEWDHDKDFWQNTTLLQRVAGHISHMKGNEAGQIELQCGLKAFFVPGKSGVEVGRHENAAVTFFLGFSYDGLRAWHVQLVDSN